MNHGHQRSAAGTKLQFIPSDIEDSVFRLSHLVKCFRYCLDWNASTLLIMH